MSEKDDILKKSRGASSESGSFPKSRAGFVIGFITRNLGALSKFIHKWGKP